MTETSRFRIHRRDLLTKPMSIGDIVMYVYLKLGSMNVRVAEQFDFFDEIWVELKTLLNNIHFLNQLKK